MPKSDLKVRTITRCLSIYVRTLPKSDLSQRTIEEKKENSTTNTKIESKEAFLD